MGALAFWRRFYSDPIFQQKMRNAWKGHRVNREKIIEAAKLGYIALQQHCASDAEFKRKLDCKLTKSRSRGGAISLRNLGEKGFKARLELMKNELVKYKYSDQFGNRLRSSLELKVARLLSTNGISYSVEPRFVCGDHAYYPDFLIDSRKPKIIEVMGVGTEKYWDNAARKMIQLTNTNLELEIALVTSFSRLARRHLEGIPRVSILRWSELNDVVHWCRNNVPG
jgi:hypothetical protein